MYHESRSCDVWSLRYKTQQSFFVILGHFLTLLTTRKIKTFTKKYHFIPMYHKWWSHDVWFLKYGVQKTEFLVILDYFFLFDPPNNPENKKMHGDIIILHECTINKNHMIYMYFWYIWYMIYIYMHFTKYTENKVFSCDSPCL